MLRKGRAKRAVVRLSGLTVGVWMVVCLGALARAEDPPLRLSESADAVIADLDRYIPRRMAEADVSGLSIALIRDNRIVWTQGIRHHEPALRRPDHA